MSRRPGAVRSQGVDLLVIVAFVGLVLALGLARREYIGDGVRHVSQALRGVFVLGEPRWLLFPSALAAWIGVAKALAVTRGIDSALVSFVVLDVLAGSVYLLALRSILRAQGADSVSVRAQALALGASFAPLLVLASDAAEPMLAAALAMGGVALAASGAQEAVVRPGAARIALGVVLVGLGALLYQGAILALFFVPALLSPFRLLHKKVFLSMASALFLVAAIFVILLIAGGGSDRVHAVARVASISENDLYNEWLRSSFRFPRLVALAIGPSQGIFYLRDFTGMRSLLAGLTHPATRPRAAADLGELVVGVGIFLTLVVTTIRAGRPRFLLALVGIAILPVVLRPSEYGYVKFWVFFPAFASLAAVYLAPVPRIAIAMVVAVVNVGAIATDVVVGRAVYAERAQAYRHASERTCWLDPAWGPRVPQAWPGRTCALMSSLAVGHGDTTEHLMAGNQEAFRACLRWCYCDADATWTDGFLRENARSIRAVAEYFRFRELDERLFWASDEGGHSITRGKAAVPVLAYGDAARRKACAVLMER